MSFQSKPAALALSPSISMRVVNPPRVTAWAMLGVTSPIADTAIEITDTAISQIRRSLRRAPFPSTVCS